MALRDWAKALAQVLRFQAVRAAWEHLPVPIRAVIVAALAGPLTGAWAEYRGLFESYPDIAIAFTLFGGFGCAGAYVAIREAVARTSSARRRKAVLVSPVSTAGQDARIVIRNLGPTARFSASARLLPDAWFRPAWQGSRAASIEIDTNDLAVIKIAEGGLLETRPEQWGFAFNELNPNGLDQPVGGRWWTANATNFETTLIELSISVAGIREPITKLFTIEVQALYQISVRDADESEKRTWETVSRMPAGLIRALREARNSPRNDAG